MPNCDPFCYLSIYLIYSTLFLFYPILSDPIYLFVYYVHTHTPTHTHTYIYVCVYTCFTHFTRADLHTDMYMSESFC